MSGLAKQIVNIIMPRFAKWKKRDLPDNYWKDPFFKKEYIRQIQKANSLLLVYSYADIRDALMRKENLWISSLFAKQLVQSIMDNVRNKEIEECKSQIEFTTKEEQVYQPKPPKTNKINRLD
jgi:hypothetical protein